MDESNSNRIVEILHDTRFCLVRSENCSDWAVRDSDEIVSEISELADRLLNGAGTALDELRILFAPTGEIQEHSIAGNWGDEFLKLAKRFDEAIADF